MAVGRPGWAQTSHSCQRPITVQRMRLASTPFLNIRELTANSVIEHGRGLDKSSRPRCTSPKGWNSKREVVMACDDEILPLQGRIASVTDEGDL